MSDTLYGKVRIYGEAEQTITITNGKGNSRTIQTTGQDYTDVVLAGLEEYILSNGIISKSVLLDIGDFKEIGLSSIPLESLTWQQIHEYIQDDKFALFFSVGDTKTFQINNKTYTAEVVSINDGTGSNGKWYPNHTVDFICKELYETTYPYNPSNKNDGGFPSSVLKNTLNNTIYPLLPTNLKDLIIEKDHMYQSGNKYSSGIVSVMRLYSTNLWLPTYYEVSGTAFLYAPGEDINNNKVYVMASKIKRLNGGSNSIWWLDSPYLNDSRAVNIVDTDGNYSNYGASTAYGVPICFRIS